MRRLLLAICVGLAVLVGFAAKGQAQHGGRRFGGGQGFGGGGWGPHSPPPHHPGNGFFPQPRPVVPVQTLRPTPRPSPMPRPIATSSRPRPISTNKAVKQTTRPRPIFTGKSIKPTLRPKVGPGRRTVITNAKPSLRRGSKVGIVSAKGSAARKNRKQVVLTKQNQALILKALKRIGRRISSALLLSALQNMGCGQPLSAAQAGCLGQYLNDPGCQLTADEQGCIQQCLAGDGDPGVDDGGDTGGEDNAVSDTDDGSAAPDEGGVLIQSVKEGAAADQAGLRAGDVILSFGDVRTHTFDELQDAVGQASGPVKVVFVNGENGQTEYVMVEPEDGLIGVTCE